MKGTLTILAKKILPHSLRIQLRKANWMRKYYTKILRGGSSSKPVYCPIADQEFKCFISKQEGVWHSDLTVSNGAKNRHRLVWLYLQNKTRIFTAPVTLLHVAPEFSYFPKLKAIKTLDYLPGDKMVDGYGKQAGVQYMDLLDLKLADQSVDYILCNHVLEHLPDDIAAMKQMYRVLRKGGEAIITVPIDESLAKTYEDFSITTPAGREKHFGQWDHVRWYATDIKARLESVGFETSLERYGETFSKEDYTRFGLCEDLIVVAKKPC